MRRLPVYFLVDVSESMVGAPIQQVQDGMRMIVQELRTDPYALETAYISVIAFAGKAKCVSPLTELYKFYPPTFPITVLLHGQGSQGLHIFQNVTDGGHIPSSIPKCRLKCPDRAPGPRRRCGSAPGRFFPGS